MINYKKKLALFLSLIAIDKNVGAQFLTVIPLQGGFTIIVPFPIISKKKKWNIANQFEFTPSGEDNVLTFQTQATYGLTERIGANIFIPFFLKNKSGTNSSKGISDIVTNLEYILLNQKENQALIQAGLEFPTGSIKKKPVTGSGTLNAAFKAAAFHTSEKWYGMVDLNAFLTHTKKRRKPGNNYFFELTFGRFFNLAKEPNSSVLDINIDMEGLYAQPDTFLNHIVPNTGGMLILVGPQFSWNYKQKVAITTAIQWPIAQRLFGNQSLVNYTTYIYLEVTF